MSKQIFWGILAALFLGQQCFAIEADQARAFGVQDLQVSGESLISYKIETGEHVLVFEDGFSMSIGGNYYSSGKAVLWLDPKSIDYRGRALVEYEVTAYLESSVKITRGRGAKTVNIIEKVLEAGQSHAFKFTANGEVFVTADQRMLEDPRGTVFYEGARQAVSVWPESQIKREAIVPLFEPEVEIAEPEVPASEAVRDQVRADKGPEEIRFRYPVNISPAGAESIDIEYDQLADGSSIATVRGRFYVWQKVNEGGMLLELMADEGVIFYSGNRSEEGAVVSDAGGGDLRSIYLSGNVLITEGARTLSADEIFYNFQSSRALAVNAELRNFDEKRGIPIYVRADRIKRLSETQFAANDVTVTSSEFYKPQVSLTASNIIITDTTVLDQAAGTLSDNSYDVQMKDVRFKMGERTILRLPGLRSNMQRPDIPLKSVHVGNDSIWGTSVETEWHLSRLLGLKEPEGVETTLNLDYLSKRGFGVGGQIKYEREKYYGRMLGYFIHDRGSDRLGRDDARRDVDPGGKSRGRFIWEHRQFLPYNWQLTTGIDYSTDENFVEAYFRDEFLTRRRETYLNLKRIENNWGVSFLAKARINDFEDQMEELPSVEHHLAGQSIFGDRFTLYSDTFIGRMRQRIGDDHTTMIDENIYTFVSHRTELDMPFQAGTNKLVPFVAATFGYDDRSGFRRSLVDGRDTGPFGEKSVAIGELGVRIFPNPLWKDYPNVKSRLWDLDRMRHIIAPRITAVAYAETDDVVEQRDTINVGLTQRLQTLRGEGENRRAVDWMRLDVDATWVNNSEPASNSGADRFIWAKPFIPMRVFSAPEIFNGDLEKSLHRFEDFGPRRNYIGGDYIWRVSDSMAVLSDLNYDMQSGVFQQYNVGIARLAWPNLHYYIGSRYLRRTEVLGEKGSNAMTFAATYVLDPRYTIVFSQQFDFDYGANLRSDITLIRKYHRMYCGFTYSADASLDRQAVVLSLWPQGIPEMAIGQRRYMGIGGGYR
jgi:hypothetical protein